MEVEGASTAVSQQVADENQVSLDGGKKKQKRRNMKVSLPPNTIREVFLKNIFYLDKDYSKFVVVGYFESYEHKVGILFKTGKSYVFWSYQTFNDLAVHFDNITSSLITEAKTG
jgi:hypothetical protein